MIKHINNQNPIEIDSATIDKLVEKTIGVYLLRESARLPLLESADGMLRGLDLFTKRIIYYALRREVMYSLPNRVRDGKNYRAAASFFWRNYVVVN